MHREHVLQCELWVVRDCRPLSMVEDIGYRMIMARFGTRLHHIDSRMILSITWEKSQNLINQFVSCYKKYKLSLLPQMFGQTEHSTHLHHLLSILWKKWNMHSYLLAIHKLTERHTETAVAQLVSKVASEFGILEKVL